MRLDRAILRGLPLTSRTRNCLLRTQLMVGTNALTVAEMRRTRGVGPRSEAKAEFPRAGQRPASSHSNASTPSSSLARCSGAYSHAPRAPASDWRIASSNPAMGHPAAVSSLRVCL